VNEPADHTAWVDAGGDTWVRTDDMPGQYGSWWPIIDGPAWEEWARRGVGQARTWDQVEEYGPFVEADAERTARSIERVRQEISC
jgi:hypothetical protein